MMKVIEFVPKFSIWLMFGSLVMIVAAQNDEQSNQTSSSMLAPQSEEIPEDGEEGRTAKVRSLTNRMLTNVRCTFYQKAVIPMTKLFNLSVPMPKDIPDQCQPIPQTETSMMDPSGGTILTTVVEKLPNNNNNNIPSNKKDQSTTDATGVGDVEVPIQDEKGQTAMESFTIATQNPPQNDSTTDGSHTVGSIVDNQQQPNNGSRSLIEDKNRQ